MSRVLFYLINYQFPPIQIYHLHSHGLTKHFYSLNISRYHKHLGKPRFFDRSDRSYNIIIVNFIKLFIRVIEIHHLVTALSGRNFVHALFNSSRLDRLLFLFWLILIMHKIVEPEVQQLQLGSRGMFIMNAAHKAIETSDYLLHFNVNPL